MEFSTNAAKLHDQLWELTNGKLFRVTFNKRTTGEQRTMVCRMGVRKGLTGTGHKFEPEDRNLIVVYDFHKKGYRMIAVEGITEFQINGKIYKVN